MSEQDYLDDAIRRLNEALKVDPKGIQRLFNLKVKCNSSLADHPTFQIREDSDGYWVTPIGLVNGILGVREDGWGHVAIVYDLKCPKHGLGEHTAGKVLDDICGFPDTPVKAARGCLNRLVLGDIVRFERVQR